MQYIVGGVRRSAMISLSDLSDREMALCKSGAWWEQAGFRSYANNSAVYRGRPPMGQFLEEWTSLYNSHSGERGMINRRALQQQAAMWAAMKTVSMVQTHAQKSFSSHLSSAIFQLLLFVQMIPQHH
jgi:hypothetical protein